MAGEQTAYLDSGSTGTDVVIAINCIDSTGSHTALTIDTTTTRLHGYSVVPTVDLTIGTGIAKITFGNVQSLTEGQRLICKVNGTAGGTAFSEYAIPVIVRADERGTDNASTFDNTVDTVITDTASRNASKADVSLLATAASISALNDFDPASDQVIVATNNDKTGYSISGTKTTLDDLNDIAASAIVSGGAINTSAGAVSNVTLVDTTTTNTDMRGTDSAFLASSAPANFASLGINASGHILRTVLNDTTTTNTDMVSVSGLSTFNPATDTVANVTTVGSVTNAVTTDTASRDASKADVSGLSTFDPTSQSVTVGTNNDKTGYALSSAANDAIGAAFLAYTLTKGSPGTIERAFWQSLKATQLTDGEVSGTPTASAFDTNLTAVTGAYDHLLLLFTSGSLAGEARPIATYNSTNGRITLQEALTAAPSSSDEFIVVPDHSHPVSEIVEGIFNEPQAGYTTAGTFGYYLDSQISAAGGAADTAAIADAVWDESRAGHTTSGTFGYYLDAQVSTAGAGIYSLTVTVKDVSDNLISGARVNIDGTASTLTSNSSGQVVFNLDAGSYTLVTSPPSGYQTPANVNVTVSSDDSSEIILTATSTTSDAGWLG